jgi:hypothetical protein
MEQVGSDVVIHTSRDTSITLLDVQLSSLASSDFLFQLRVCGRASY